MPGLLQTEAYVRAITAASFPSEHEEESERRVALRLARQDLLKRPAPPEYWVVLEETVLRRPIGGTDVMRGQVEYLIECAARPNITIQVLPVRRRAGTRRCTACSTSSASPTTHCPTSSTARA